MTESAEANFGLASKVTRVKLDLETFRQLFKERRTALLFAQSEELQVVESPLVEIPAAAPSGRLTLESGALVPAGRRRS